MAEENGTFMGIADCHGLESLIPIKEANPTFLQIRANANSQRHALVFRVELTKRQKIVINERMANGDYIGALKYLKNKVKTIDISKGREKSWKLIPNPDLDPWG